MSDTTLYTKVFDPHTAGHREWVALNAFSNQVRAEQWPEDPPLTVEDTMHEWRAIPPFWAVHAWTVWSTETSQVVAMASIGLWRADHNQHCAHFDITVLPEWRQRGIARQLLAVVTEVARSEKRRLLLTTTDAALPGGAAFMQRLEARSGLTVHTNQLALCDLNRELVRRWQDLVGQQGRAYELGLWQGPYPEGELQAIVAIRAVMNTAPRDELEVEDVSWTGTQLRQVETTLAQHQTERWTMYVRHTRTGALVGYTEVFWNARQAETLQQGDTAVSPPHRHRGLGRWLKAAMLEKVLHERPQVKRIRTGNATSNATMLSINRELGFKSYKSWTTWQIAFDDVLAYLVGP